MAKQVDATYGNALFELAVEENKIDTLYEETKSLVVIMNDNEELIKLLSHPHITKEAKIDVVKKSFDGRLSNDLTGLLLMVVEKNHAKEIVPILKFFIKQVKLYKKIGEVSVTSAVELSDEKKKAIEARLLQTTQFLSLEVAYNVDKSLIGGMIIRIDDRVVDSSIKTKIDGMSKALARA